MNGKQLKNSILQWAIQGKLVPQDPNDEPASVLLERIRAEKARLVKEKKIKKEKPLPDIIDNEIPFDVPESWKWVKVGNVGSWSSGATPSRTNPAYYGGSIPWLKTGDLNDGFIQEVPEYITDLALEKTSLRLNPEKFLPSDDLLLFSLCCPCGVPSRYFGLTAITFIWRENNWVIICELLFQWRFRCPSLRSVP